MSRPRPVCVRSCNAARIAIGPNTTPTMSPNSPPLPLMNEPDARVFEKKSFEDQNPEREPREHRCADVDGDGKTDLVLLVHDKLIVYLQE